MILGSVAFEAAPRRVADRPATPVFSIGSEYVAVSNREHAGSSSRLVCLSNSHVPLSGRTKPMPLHEPLGSPGESRGGRRGSEEGTNAAAAPALAVTSTYLRRLEGQEDKGWDKVAEAIGV